MATIFFAINTTMQEMEYAFEGTYHVLVNYPIELNNQWRDPCLRYIIYI
jgi:hypothetical protein